MAGQLQPQTTAVNGVELSYIAQGSGIPVVFVHGSLNDFRSWGSQVEAFAQHYRVVAYSRRYHYPNGGPGPDAPGYVAATQRDDLAALIKTLGLAPAHLVGSSYGAYVSLLLAARYPELVRSLTLGEPPALTLLGNQPGGPLDKQLQVLAVSRQAFDAGDMEQGVRVFIDSVIGSGAFDRVPPPARQMMLDNAPEMALETRTPPEQYFPYSAEEARAVRVPSMLLTGEVSPKMFSLVTDVLEDCLPHRERAVIPRASHGMHGMNPSAYNETVLAFLATH